MTINVASRYECIANASEVKSFLEYVGADSDASWEKIYKRSIVSGDINDPDFTIPQPIIVIEFNRPNVALVYTSLSELNNRYYDGYVNLPSNFDVHRDSVELIEFIIKQNLSWKSIIQDLEIKDESKIVCRSWPYSLEFIKSTFALPPSKLNDYKKNTIFEYLNNLNKSILNATEDSDYTYVKHIPLI